MRRVPAAVACLLIAVLTALYAQDKVLKVDVDIVNILFTVHDKRNGLVGGLQKGDFTVLEDGKEQTIKYFTRETDLPLTIGLLIDVSKSQENMIEPEKRAASKFFSEVLRPKDMAFLISFGPDADLLQDYTNSAKLLKQGLEDLKVSTNFTGMMGPGPVPTANRPRRHCNVRHGLSGGQREIEARSGPEGDCADHRRHGSGEPLQNPRGRGSRAEGRHHDLQHLLRGPAQLSGKRFGLKKMSDETGGRVFHVDGRNSLQDIFTQIQEEMRSQYSIGYTPTNPNKDGSYRKLEIRTAAKELKVQARKGYYATPNEAR
jgi:hypothetical protein